MNESDLKQNQRLLIQAFKSQNEQAYDQTLEKLQQVGDNLIRMIQNIEYNSQFYMKHMPLMKQQRQLINEKDYKQFMNKNEKILCRNFEKNAYLALLMQQMQQKKHKQQKLRWSQKQQVNLKKLISQGANMKTIYNKFSRRGKHQVDQKYKQLINKKQTIQQKIQSSQQDNQFINKSSQ